MGRRSRGKALALVWTAEDESLNSGSRAEDESGLSEGYLEHRTDGS